MEITGPDGQKFGLGDLVRPLGGDYDGRYWNATQEDLAGVESVIEFPLPDTYKELVSTYGCSCWYGESDEFGEYQLWYLWDSDEHQESENNIDLFFGANTPSRSYDIVAGASSWLEGKPLLLFAEANNGDFFYLSEGGAVYFEPPQNSRFPRGPTRMIATSFDQFVDRLELRIGTDELG